MATVYLTSAHPDSHAKAARITEKYAAHMRELAGEADRHELCDDPHAADIILVYVAYAFFIGDLDPLRRCVRNHPAVRQHRAKAFVYDPEDLAIPFIPGVYASVSARRYDPQRQRAGPYLMYLRDTEPVEPSPASEAEYLFSFIGSVGTHPCRSRIMALDHPRGLLRDTTGESLWGDPERVARFKARFQQGLSNARFVLCPRGRGTSSIRLFEAMRAGRAPVIISDDGVLPAGPQWEQFSLQVPEGQVHTIPHLLEQREAEAEAMGRASRHAWERWFSPAVVFDRIVDACLELQRSQAATGFREAASIMRYVLRSRRDIARTVRDCWPRTRTQSAT